MSHRLHHACLRAVLVAGAGLAIAGAQDAAAQDVQPDPVTDATGSAQVGAASVDVPTRLASPGDSLRQPSNSADEAVATTDPGDGEDDGDPSESPAGGAATGDDGPTGAGPTPEGEPRTHAQTVIAPEAIGHAGRSGRLIFTTDEQTTAGDPMADRPRTGFRAGLLAIIALLLTLSACMLRALGGAVTTRR